MPGTKRGKQEAKNICLVVGLWGESWSNHYSGEVPDKGEEYGNLQGCIAAVHYSSALSCNFMVKRISSGIILLKTNNI